MNTVVQGKAPEIKAERHSSRIFQHWAAELMLSANWFAFLDAQLQRSAPFGSHFWALSAR